MIPQLSILELSDYGAIAVLGLICAIVAGYVTRQAVHLGGLESQLEGLERKVDALLQHQGVRPPQPPPSGLSPEVERLARSPENLIAAIKLYREQTPGTGLAEAKAKIEAFRARKR